MAQITYREAIRQALREEMTRDERVYIMGEDIGAYGGSYAVTKGFLDEWGPDRIVDTPIAEGGIVGVATGAAMHGMRPIVEIMSINFSLLAMDQICNHASKLHYMFNGQITVPLVIRTASGWGQLAATHSQTFEAWYASMPGLKVAMPATPYDAKGMLISAIRDPDPVMFIEHSLLYGTRGEVPEGDYTVPLGQAEVKREGTDLTIVTYSRSLMIAQQAADQLAKQDISVEIVDLRSLRPLDTGPAVASVQKTNRALVVEEDWRSCGMGAEIVARLQEEAFDYLDAPIMRIAAVEVPLPYAKNLERLCYPTEQDVVGAALKLLNR
ncbi:MAG: alpha-ketoacid dehydrogenase subunit beta [Thermomicrobiales bacterium]|jgi:pyruvate dehydrogenase E1 component beta subunit|nr:alpha-ketoacid dehydrogenase subunit beta [Thermomicrobiales bacterium]